MAMWMLVIVLQAMMLVSGRFPLLERLGCCMVAMSFRVERISQGLQDTT